MLSFKDRLYISTTAEDGETLAKTHGLGLEIAEYCTAENMDTRFAETDAIVRRKMTAAGRFTFHAAFNELCPAAIDPLVVEITKKRYAQAVKTARDYGIKRMVVHSGYTPLVYFKSWFTEKSIAFWKEFLREVPEDMTLCYENVMEDAPDMPVEIVREVNDPRFCLCLDVGHANCQISEVPVEQWVDSFAPWLGHVHLHNNEGGWDIHAPLGEGSIPMKDIIRRIEEKCSGVTYAIENMYAAQSVEWLQKEGFLA